MDAQTQIAILKQILPYALGADFGPDTLHGHTIGFELKEWPKNTRVIREFTSTPLPLSAPFNSVFSEVRLRGTIGDTPDGYDEFPVQIGLRWQHLDGGSNGSDIGSFYFRPGKNVLFAYRMVSNAYTVVYI
jgi:hypothetical protein